MDFCKDYSLPDWTSGFEQRKTSATQLPYEEYTGPLEKSTSDTNNYKLIRLPNNLVVICVQDADTETAAAVLSVNVGSSMDPVELQGLAHFLEHMLFMGTEKYPDEDEYLSFISEHSGYSNASTSFSRTKYYFDIANDAFEEALDRFSSFFTSSLLKPDCVDRELCAVDSEFKGLLNNDGWRCYQLTCKLSSPDHPFSKFMVGSIEALKQSAKDHGLNLHEELLKFYNKYYSSDIMKLVVCGNHSLDQLVEWAVSKFSGIASKGDNVQRVTDHPVTKEFLDKVVYYETVNDVHTMEIAFPMPDTKAVYRYDPLQYIAHLIGHEGHGSILAYLKKQGWATGVSAGSNVDESLGFNNFFILVDATMKGLDHCDDILRTVFSYVQMLVSVGPQEWIQQEMSSMRKMQFDNMVKVSALKCVLSNLRLVHNEYVAPKHVLSKDNAYERFNHDDILHCLAFMNPGNFRVFVGASKHNSVDCLDVEPYFETKYHVDTISNDLVFELASNSIHNDSLYLPEKNEFMPSDFTIKNLDMLGAAAVFKPTLLRLNDNLELWFKQDDHACTPKGSILLSIKVPTVSNSPQNHIMSNLFGDMLVSKMYEDLYNATNAGLMFSVGVTSSTIDIRVEGFNDKLPDLLETILSCVKSFKADATQFSIYMAKFKQDYANYANSIPTELCVIYKGYINDVSSWHYRLLEAELGNVTLAKLQKHVDSLFDVTYTKMVMVGNFDEEKALRTAEKVQSVIVPMPNVGYSLDKPKVYDFEPGYYVHQVQVPNTDCVNSAVLSQIYCGLTTDKREAVLLDVIEDIVHNSFFAQLRTKHQLGYRVRAYRGVSPGGRSSLILRVEGESNPMYVTMHISKFIHDMQQRLADLTSDQFNNRVQSLIRIYLERVKNINEEAARYSAEVKRGTYDFELHKEKARLLQTVAKEEMLEFWNKYINPSTAPAYTRIDVQMWSTKIWKPTASNLKTYSAKTLALFGCLMSEGNSELDISKVDEFISTSIAAIGDSADPLAEKLKSACLSESGAVYTAGKSAERETHTNTALELAINDYETFGNYSGVCRTNFATIGMNKTPDGIWIIEDYRKFQATQPMCGSELPVEALVPKYSS
ncbi:metalloprotease [Coemansia sp. BCRC 34301]|nr:metalloprotease [Coemansia sp. BCRC 34301]